LPIEIAVEDTKFLRIYLIKAHFENSIGGFFDKMSPYVDLAVGSVKFWKSSISHKSDKDPKWKE